MSRPLDPDIDQALALVVDGNPASRRTLATMLREFGVRRIEQAVRPQDARGMLEIRPFDIVLCDYHFPGEGMNGQELMDDLRQSGILPLSTVVVMISGEASCGQVAEASEVALDAYLLKPHTAKTLRQASRITPHSVARLVELGLVQFYVGDVKEAGTALVRAVKLGISSKLLSAAERTLNAKLMDLAIQTVRRHASAIEQADVLMARLQHLHDTYRSYGAQVRIARNDDARSMQAVARPDTVLPGGDAAPAGTVAS